MALKEGRCPNCGSILQLDSSVEKGHCLFCDAVFDNYTAISIAENPKGVEFPNLPQPKYEGPSLEPKTGGAAGQAALRQKQSQQVVKKPKPAPPAPYVHKEPIKLPDIRMSKKTKMRVLLITVVVIAIIAAISVPTVLIRDKARAQLVSSMAAIAPFSIDATQAVTIRRTSNSYLLVASSASVPQADMVKLFKSYCVKRAEVQNINTDDFQRIYGQVTVKLVTPDGGYLIDQPADQAALDSGSAVKVLEK